MTFVSIWTRAVAAMLVASTSTVGLAAPIGSSYARAYVQKAYVAYYGRPADPAGQDFWATQMDAAGGSLSAIIAAFGNSVEFNQRYGGLPAASLVTKIYQQALGRNPDPGGLQYYVGELQAGRKTPQTITLDVLNGATTEPDSTVIANKLQVAAYYTSRVAGGCPYGTEQYGVGLLAAVVADYSTAIAQANAINGKCGANSGSTSQGIWYGLTSTNQIVWGVILDTGRYYFYYISPATPLPSGFAQGSLGISDGQDFNTDYGYVLPFGVNFGYYTRSYMMGTVIDYIYSTPFSALYNPEYERPASVAEASGFYFGNAATPATRWETAPVTVFPNGSLSGAMIGCNFSGTIVPHGAVNVFDLTITFQGGFCVFGTSTLFGIAYYDPLLNGFVAMAPNAARDNGFMFFGRKQ